MIRLPRISLLPLLFAIVMPAHAAGLPDTGQDTCYNDTEAVIVAASDPASIARDAGSHPRQDCRYGRDAAAAAGRLTKTGAGTKGFDYTKIANDGSELTAGATLGAAAGDWACTKDNITGLTWEVKTTSGLRNKDSNYSWYSSDSSTNGVNAGTANGGTCDESARCDTEKFVADVNSAVLCGFFSGWRMPTRRELLTLVVFDGSSPAIDPTYFINTNPLGFWSGSSYVPDSTKAWGVFFDNYSSTFAHFKSSNDYVRLVHGEPF
jgi:hypothetical protein